MESWAQGNDGRGAPRQAGGPDTLSRAEGRGLGYLWLRKRAGVCQGGVPSSCHGPGPASPTFAEASPWQRSTVGRPGSAGDPREQDPLKTLRSGSSPAPPTAGCWAHVSPSHGTRKKRNLAESGLRGPG